MTEARPPAEATVAILTALALAASWAVVASTDAARAETERAASVASLRAAPAPGLVPAPAPRPRPVRRRSRAS